MSGRRDEQHRLRRVLASRQREQRARFDQCKTSFEAHLRALCTNSISALVSPEWQERILRLERDFLPWPPFDFLQHPDILYTMFVSEKYFEHELPVVESTFDEAAMAVALDEDCVGGPRFTRLPDRRYYTSSNSVHHLHHLARFTRSTGVQVSDLETVVEWGGGYGNFAKLFRRLHGGSPTYVVLDLPIFSCLQWLYLTSALGPDSVNLVYRQDQPCEPGKINVMPVTLADTLPNGTDLFVSTWALNESSPAAQHYVVDRDWFGARHLVLGMHEGEWLQEVAIASGATSEPLGHFMPGQRYIVR